jgi:hypothetical protein
MAAAQLAAAAVDAAGRDVGARTAQLSLEREYANAKTILPQVQLLLDIFNILETDNKDDSAVDKSVDKTSSTGVNNDGTGSGAASGSSRISHWNPYRMKKSRSYMLMHKPLIEVHPNAAKRIIKLIDSRDHKKIISVLVHRLYFNALIQQKHYDKVFILGTLLANDLKGYTFQNVITKLMEDVAFPRLKTFLDSALIVDKAQPWFAINLTSGSLTVMNILYNCIYLPTYINKMLPEYIVKLTTGLQKALTAMQTSRLYKPVSINFCPFVIFILYFILTLSFSRI